MPLPPSIARLRRALRPSACLALIALIGTLWVTESAGREGPRSEPLAAASAPEERWVAVERRLALMGTWLRISLEAPTRAEGLRTSERLLRQLEAAEARLSTWRGDSELARLNAAPVGERVALSPALAHELCEAVAWSAATEGAFDPALAPLVEAWSLRSGGRQPKPTELAAAREASGRSNWSFTATSARRLHTDAGLEEGAFGKGAGLDAALASIQADHWRALSVELGGQLLDARHAGKLRRELADPRARDRAALALLVPNGSLATSGDSERAIVVDGEERSHILDPRTGAPAPSRGSATVWTESALAADCLSTACYVLGPEAALAFASRTEGVELIWIEVLPGGLRARATNGLARCIEPLAEDLELIFHAAHTD